MSSLLQQPYSAVQALALQAFIQRNNPRPGIESRLTKEELHQMVVEYLQLQLAKESTPADGVAACMRKNNAILATIAQAFPQLAPICKDLTVN
jgi:hypothetical protein